MELIYSSALLIFFYGELCNDRFCPVLQNIKLQLLSVCAPIDLQRLQIGMKLSLIFGMTNSKKILYRKKAD